MSHILSLKYKKFDPHVIKFYNLTRYMLILKIDFGIKILDRSRKSIHRKKDKKEKKKKKRRRIETNDSNSSGSDFNPFS